MKINKYLVLGYGAGIAAILGLNALLGIWSTPAIAALVMIGIYLARRKLAFMTRTSDELRMLNLETKVEVLFLLWMYLAGIVIMLAGVLEGGGV